MLKFRNSSHIPPGHVFKYRDPDTKVLLLAGNFSALEQKVWTHRLANQLPPVSDTIIEDNAAQHVIDSGHPELVMDTEHDFIPVRPTLAMRLQQIKRGTLTITANLIRGNPLVDQGEAETRAAICAGCSYNVNPIDCTSCNLGIVEALVKATVGNRKTNAHAKLKSCAACGCMNQVQIWYPLDVLQRFIPDTLNATLPTVCWKKRP